MSQVGSTQASERAALPERCIHISAEALELQAVVKVHPPTAVNDRELLIAHVPGEIGKDSAGAGKVAGK